MRFHSLLCLLFLVLTASLTQAQTGCPGCETVLPDLPADTLYLSDAPAGQAGQYYSGDLSFRLPMTTTPVAAVDSTVLPGLPINQITINSVAGLPPGLSWEASQLIFMTQLETDGCVRFCGTPLLPGLYQVQVVITAQVFVFTQTTSFSFPLLIEPSASITDGFTIINDAACGSLTASFINNVPSGGASGFSYLWDFGNGNSSVAENPPAQTYTQPGEYAISYQAIVDTAGFYLTQVTVEELSCVDILNGAPDVKIDVYDPSGAVIYTSAILTNAVPPLVFDLYLPIGPGNYSLEVIDDDGGLDGADDLCGIITFNRFTNDTIQSGSLRSVIRIAHPVDTIQSRSSVEVFEIPDAPHILTMGPLCVGGTAFLEVSNYSQDLQWYRDSLPLATTSSAILPITTTGSYWATYTSEQGCTAVSNLINVTFVQPPPAFTIQQSGNLLRLPASYNLSLFYSLSWALDGEPIAGANGPLLCALSSGVYTLFVTNITTGCIAMASIEVTYDPGLSCTTGVAEQADELSQWTLFPNPGYDWAQLQGTLTDGSEVQYQLFDVTGRLWHSGSWLQSSGPVSQRFLWGELPAGVYSLHLSSNSQHTTLKWIKQ